MTALYLMRHYLPSMFHWYGPYMFLYILGFTQFDRDCFEKNVSGENGHENGTMVGGFELIICTLHIMYILNMNL